MHHLHVEARQQVHHMIQQIVVIQQLTIKAIAQSALPEIQIVGFEALSALALDMVHPATLLHRKHAGNAADEELSVQSNRDAKSRACELQVSV